MNFVQSNLQIRQQLASLTSTSSEDWFLTFRGRDALAVTYSAISKIIGYGEVITSSYLSLAAINPIIYGKLRPKYIDIDPSLLSFAEVPEDTFTPKTRAIFFQNTLGIISDRRQLKKQADEKNLILIESSVHCATRMARDKKNNILADISVHSFGAEKILTETKFGAAIYVNPELKKKNPELYNEIINQLFALKKPSYLEKISAYSLKPANHIYNKAPENLKQITKTALHKTKILKPSISKKEQQGLQKDPKSSTEYINEQILLNLPKVKRSYERRINNVKLYNKTLFSKDFDAVYLSEEPLLAYPIVFSSIARANAAYELLTTTGFFVRRYYSPLLYPGPIANHKYFYNPKNAPIAEELSLRTISLPTDLPTRDTQKIIKLLNGTIYRREPLIS